MLFAVRDLSSRFGSVRDLCVVADWLAGRLFLAQPRCADSRKTTMIRLIRLVGAFQSCPLVTGRLSSGAFLLTRRYRIG